jgi:ribokinase
MKKAVVIGSINMDVILKVDEIPKVGETKIAEEMKIAGGGKGANQAVAINRLGSSVCMVGKVGNDKFGGNLIDSLKDSGVDIKGIVVDEFNSTGTAYITVSLCNLCNFN